MTTLAHRSELRAARHGGVAARRALIRWATRLLRREWRQQILVITLLTIAVAVAVGSITVVYNTGAADDAELGSASDLLRFDGSDPRRLEAGVASARRSLGTTDVIGHRSIPVPGGVENVDFRAQDPRGAYGGALLALRRGSYPVGAGQVAVSDGVADLLRLRLGATLALDGRRRTVVGIVENPRDLSDEFALVSPSSAGAPDQVTVLVDASDASIESFFRRNESGESALVGSEERENSQAEDALATFSVATVFLILASLVAAAGFAVVAQRRLRQLGMLAAVGATHKQLRLVLVTNGALVGVIAAVGGTLIGLALWVIVAPTLESAIGHRGDRRRLVAGANGRPRARHARALGATAAAAARTQRRLRGRRPDRLRHRLPRALGPRQAAADRRGDRGDHHRLPAPRPAGDPRLLRLGRTSLGRAAIGAARPRPLSGPFRRGPGGGHARARHRGDRRRRHIGGAREAGGRAAQPVRPTDPGLHRPAGAPGGARDPDTGPTRTPGRRRPSARGPTRRSNGHPARQALRAGRARRGLR